ncbi:exonuclease SbcCD subunit D [Pseudooceanicola sp. CBS1P-1]|uniref:Nuclease SbcCD subunit D n=1 Tax=Pseudooceanicola albus TaxID=2692189 RepID=A0A6L7G649_9RHOB|nr:MULTISPECIES: exonuclease SbcCD subunit D [Pseudooceanicola]MBT9385984.1 exonuclease SbcCD subunit D [Pseudooceanicola endophyticus]MXN19595.1 exonuclease subunit SbcD [Pseudooceanicola albus]
MRILHTADWHIGQTLNGWSRDAEHALWLEQLAGVLAEEEIDVLLVAGDVFDGINPSGEAQRLLYSALRRFRDVRPRLVTVMIAGNHDPAGRLEAPRAILESLDVHVVGSLRRHGTAVDAAAHVIDLPDASGAVAAHVCAVPFLRAADLPGLRFEAGEDRGSPVVAAARALHMELAEAARAIAGPRPLIALGHLHCQGGTESEGAERRILIGGEHAVPPDIFPAAFDYVALGHLHRPQSLDGGRVRYAGSCFPLSAAEAGYDHGVTVLELKDGRLEPRHRPLPRPAGMLRLPARGALAIEDLERALEALALDPDLAPGLRPFVQLELEATAPAPVLIARAETALAARPLRPAGLRVRRAEAAPEAPPPVSLQDTSPEELFRKAFEKTNGQPPGAAHVAAFRDAASEV